MAPLAAPAVAAHSELLVFALTIVFAVVLPTIVIVVVFDDHGCARSWSVAERDGWGGDALVLVTVVVCLTTVTDLVLP